MTDLLYRSIIRSELLGLYFFNLDMLFITQCAKSINVIVIDSIIFISVTTDFLLNRLDFITKHSCSTTILNRRVLTVVVLFFVIIISDDKASP